MTPEQKTAVLEKRLGFYERLAAHQKQFIEQQDLSEAFQLWLSHKVAIEGIGN